MSNLTKLLGILFGIALLALPVTGCDTPPWEAGMTLVVKVDAPKDGATVNTSTVTVSGRVLGTERASAKVSVNEANAPVKDDKFSASVTLKEGQNVIHVAATGTSGAKLSQKLNITFAPAK
jgi:hypothetical protein